MIVNVCKRVKKVVNIYSTAADIVRSAHQSSRNSVLDTMSAAPGRLVWVDCEMTGLDLKRDLILEIAVIITEGDSLQEVARSPNLIIRTEAEILNGMDEWNTKHHGKSGLTKACLESQLSMTAAEDEILNLLKKHTPQGKCPLAGNCIGQDRKFLEKCMPRVIDQLHYRVVDVSTIKELCARWNPQLMARQPKKKGSHRALDDILESIKELQFYKEEFFKI